MKNRICENCGGTYNTRNQDKRTWCTLFCGRKLNILKNHAVKERKKELSYVEIYAKSKGITVKRARAEINKRRSFTFGF